MTSPGRRVPKPPSGYASQGSRKDPGHLNRVVTPLRRNLISLDDRKLVQGARMHPEGASGPSPSLGGLGTALDVPTIDPSLGIRANEAMASFS